VGKIYVGQTALTIRLTVGQDITGATCLVKYRKPDGTEGQWSASIVTESTGEIGYTMADADQLDQSGLWTFWAYVTFSDGTVAPGEPIEKYVYSQGE